MSTPIHPGVRIGIARYTDSFPAAWPRDAKGEISMTTGSLDLDALLAESPSPSL